jgi:hypothetical protein
MRYQANALKSCVLMYRNSQRTQKKAETKAATDPTLNQPMSAVDSKWRSL